MPTVAIIGGIAIMFFYDDHNPPHFHARGADFETKIALSDLSVIAGSGRIRASDLRLIRDWGL
jgi:hypothetical protein